MGDEVGKMRQRLTQQSMRSAIHGLTLFGNRLLDKKTAFCLLVCKKWSTFANRFNNKERHEHNKTHAGCQPPVGCPRFNICHRRGTRHLLFPASLRLGAWHTQTVILGIIMLTMGLTLTTDDFRILAQRPFDVLIGTCAQFFIMPAVAWLLVHVWHLNAPLALGILLVGCCPGGVSSNIMSYLCHGDVAFSVGMTCASTLLAPVMTPLLMQITAGEIIHIDAVGMFINILIVTIIPVAIGCALNKIYSRKACFPTIQSLMPGISVTCLAIIVGGVISTVHDDLLEGGVMLFFWTFAVVFCHNSLGYLLGWLAGRAAGFNTAKKRTISIEVGMQNAGLATVLASNFFAAQPLAVLPCAISCAWHSISGTILAGLYLKYDKHKEQTN